MTAQHNEKADSYTIVFTEDELARLLTAINNETPNGPEFSEKLLNIYVSCDTKETTY